MGWGGGSSLTGQRGADGLTPDVSKRTTVPETQRAAGAVVGRIRTCDSVRGITSSAGGQQLIFQETMERAPTGAQSL